MKVLNIYQNVKNLILVGVEIYIVKIFKMNTSFYSYKHSKDKNFITDMTNYCKENNIKMTYDIIIIA